MLLLNSVIGQEKQQWIGSSQVLVGDESVAFSLANTVVKTDIVDGGIFPLEPCSGQYFTLRRKGYNPRTGNKKFLVPEIRVYESISLFSEFEGHVFVTNDTSPSLTGFGPQNLLTNLQNRSSGNNLKAIETPAIYSPMTDATRISDESCYKTTDV